jgi:hypothetical protein
LGKKKKKSKQKKKKIEKSSVISSNKINKLFIYLPFFIFLILALLYFFPFLTGGKMMGGSDWMLGEYTKRVWASEFISENKEFPMWFPYIFGGCPTVASFFGDMLVLPHTFLNIIFPVHTVRLILYIVYVFLGGMGIFLLLKELKLGNFPSLYGGICYMFSGSLISTTNAGHLGRAISVALLPLMLLFILKGVKKRKFYYYIFFAGITSLSFLGGHFQMSYYATGFSMFFLIFLLIGERKSLKMRGVIKTVLFFIAGMIVLGMIVSVSFLPVYSNLSFGARGETKGYEYTTSWSMPTAEILDLFVPEFSGIKELYWGENFFKLNNEYFGILPLILLLIGVFFCFKNRYVKFFFFIGIAALFLALGKNTPIFKLAYYLVPGIKKFRAPSLIFYILIFSTIVVGAFGLKNVIERKDSKKTIIAISVFLICFAIFALVVVVGKEGVISFLKSHFSYLTLPQSGNKLKAFNENYPAFMKGVGRSFLFLFLSFVLLFAFLKKKFNPLFLMGGLLILLLVDQWSIEKRYITSSPLPTEYYQKDNVVSFLEEDNSLYRVFPLHYRRSNDGILILYEIQSLGGYHPNPLRRYQELTGSGESVMFRPMNLIQYPKFIDLLNGKYIIGAPLPSDTTQFDERQRAMIRQWMKFFKRFSPAKPGYRYAIYRNPNYLQRAVFIEDYKSFVNKDSVLKFMKKEEFNPREAVLLEEEPGFSHPDTITGGSTVTIKKYGVNRIDLEVDAENPGFILLIENYHPRWNAYVDGEKSKVYIADYTLRAVYVSEGKHSVSFVYEDRSFTAGKSLSLVGLAILLFCFIFQFVEREKKK